jgi:hypothetical protein
MTPSYILNLANLFNGSPTHQLPAGTKLFRGYWASQVQFPCGHWFSPTLDYAAEYVAMHAQCGRTKGYTPYISECFTNEPLTFAMLQQSHIRAFAQAYGGTWNHDQIVRDIPAAFKSLGQFDRAGFFRPGTQEYFVCSPGSILVPCNTMSGAQALAEASRVKGHDV